jgi:hypothetical protein
VIGGERSTQKKTWPAPRGADNDSMRPIDLVYAAGRVELDASRVAWFAARQPGIVGFLEARCGAGDGLAVAIDAAWRMCAAFEARDGVPPRRVTSCVLERAEAITWAAGGAGPRARERGDEPPELVAWVAAWASDPPLPLSAAERRDVLGALVAVVYALDHVAAGRSLAAPA